MAVLREQGVQAPAQAIYELQLDGYEIDRVPCESSNRHTTIGYRLRTSGVIPSRSALPQVRAMSAEVAGKSGAGASTALRAVRVDLNTHGEWEIQLPDQSQPVTCETLADAQRVAYLCAAHRSPCELIVCDADHRVLRREVINRRPISPAHFLAEPPGSTARDLASCGS